MSASWVPIDDVIQRIEQRHHTCEEIARSLRIKGFAATSQKVNRNYPIWLRWYNGQLALGYALRMTGMRRIDDHT